jgi:ligand-binding SRPBCC domain-containing protein
MNISSSSHQHLKFASCPQGGWILEARQWVPAPVDQVFDFFSRPANLLKLTPEGQKMRMVPPAPETMSAGDVFTYRLRVSGIPITWVARIEAVNPPEGFEDRMLRGPYRTWHHRHRFIATEGGTLIEDTVHYRVYGCRYGHRYFYQPRLEAIFRDRGKRIDEWFVLKDGS